MKKSIFLIFLVCIVITNIVYGQDVYFEGEIIYDFEFKSTETGDDMSEQMILYFGSEQHYYVNAGNYKAYNEKGTLTQLYNCKSNKYYIVNPTNQSVTEIDADNKEIDVVEIKKLEGEEFILGISCKKILIRSKRDETIYWYTDKIKVPFENYKNHNIGNWGKYLEAVQGALPLKYVMKTPSFTMISIATKIDKIELEEKDFDINLMLGN